MRTSTDNGFARIHFSLDPVAHAKADLAAGVLTIAFDRKVAIDAATLAQGLGGYVGNAREDGDGRTFHLALSQTVRLHTSESGSSIAVDLVPETFAGVPPDLPPPPPKAASAVEIASLPALAIRVGAYSAYSRLVFDWPRKVAYAVFPGNGHLTVRFEAEARPDFSALGSVAPPWIKESGWRVEGHGTVMEFSIDPSSGFHHFRDGTKVVLDILSPKTDAATQAPKARTPEAAEARAIKETAAALREEDAPKSAVAAPAVEAGSPALAPAASQPAPHQTSGADSVSPSAPAQRVSTGTSAQRTHGGFALEFPGAAQRAMAIFVRGQTAWIVLDGALRVDIQELKTALSDVPIEASSGNGASVLRLGLKQGQHAVAQADGSILKVIVGPDVGSDGTAIGFVRSGDSRRPMLTTLLPGAAHALRLPDSSAGDTIIVVPAFLGRAAAQPHRYAELATLTTAAGLAIIPLSDDLDVSVENSRVTIGRPEGLALARSPAQSVIASPAELARGRDGPCFLDFAHWAGTPGGNVLDAQRRLRQAVARANPDESEPAQRKFAKFYLANGFAAEALGVLNVLQNGDPALKSDLQLQTMRAAADYMLGRYRDAHNDIAGSGFDNDRHAGLWRGLIDAAQRNWDAAHKELAQAMPVLARYTPEWQGRVRIADSRAALATDAIEVADADLAKMPDQLPRSIAIDAQLAHAQFMAAEGRYRDAKPIFRAIESSGNERVGAEAVYSQVEAGLSAGAMSVDTAIDMLEQLRFRWRGDALELQTLRKLGALYFAKRRWHQGLATLRVASLSFPNEDLARQAQDDMRKEFESLFLKGAADRMPPVQALGLFYDFIDLTPIGPNGDEMIRHMADRLVAVDLLEPAATLLNYQITKRLDGVARSQVATRLAMIDLLDHKPKEALEALRASQVSGLPPDLLHQRMIVQARGLAALKQWDQALDMIATDDTPDSRRLRADIYWESGSWENAGQKAEALVAPVPADARPLPDDVRAYILRAAIAYSLANDEPALDRLRKTYASKMGASRDASAFAVVTQQLDTQGTAFRDMAGQIASIDTLEAFMKDFRKRHDTERVTN